MTEAGHRYTVITPDNQSANIWVCGLTSVLLGTACLIGRGLFRFRLGFAFSLDDRVFALSWVVQVIQVGLLLKATALGLGQNNSIIDQRNVSSIQAYTAASTVMTVVALYIAKVSMIMLIGRLFTRTLRRFWIPVAVVGLVSAIQIEAGCVYPTCTTVTSRYIVYAALDIATEILVISLPIYYIQDVRMDVARKARVLVTFSSRALVILLSCLIIWAATRIREIGSFTTSITLPVIFLQLQLGASIIICAIIPSFRMIFHSTDIMLSDAGPNSRETKHENDTQQGSNRLPFHGGNLATTAAATDTQISYVRQPTPPPPPIARKPEHVPQSSQDTTAAASDMTRRPSEGRASESSLVPSGTTGLSSKPLVQAPVL